MKKNGLIAILLFSLLTVFGISCDGPAGLDGKDAEDFDHYPPQVSMSYPTPGQEVFEDTLTLVANATDDTEVERVIFSVSGKVTNGTDSAVVVDSPYVFLWNFVDAQNSFGVLDLVATAWDTAGNTSTSPMTLINRKLRSGLDTLSYCNTSGDSTFRYCIPDTTTIRIETEEDSVITFISDVTATKYTPGYRCFLRSIEVSRTFSKNELYNAEYDYWLILYEEDSDGKPGTPFDSVLVEYDPIYLNHWHSTDFSDFENFDAEMEFGPEFPIFVGLRANISLPNPIPFHGISVNSIVKSVDSDPSLKNVLFRHGKEQSDSTWTPLYSGVDKNSFIVPSIRVVVDYQGQN